MLMLLILMVLNKTLLSIGLITYPIKGNPVFSNRPKNLSRNLPDCSILCKWVFNNFLLADELFAKALRSFETCVIINNILFGKLISSLESPATFTEICKVTSVRLFRLNLLSWELDKFAFEVLYLFVFLYLYYIKTK